MTTIKQSKEQKKDATLYRAVEERLTEETKRPHGIWGTTNGKVLRQECAWSR